MMQKLSLGLICLLHSACSLAELPYIVGYGNQRAMNFVMRVRAATQSLMYPNYNVTGENVGDATAANSYASAHTKAFEHDGTTGLLTPAGLASYQQELAAIASTVQADYNAIVRAPGATMKLVCPQAACGLTLEGVTGSLVPMPLFPAISSTAAAAFLIEIYLHAICRDVRFADYGTGLNTDVDAVNGGSITNNAAAILTALGAAYTGPLSGGVVTASTLFRGGSAGDLIGPYMSQFAFFSVPQQFQRNTTFKPYVDVAQNREFGVSWTDFIDIENGKVPTPYVNADFVGQRYIITGRDIPTWVHNDGPGEIFFYAANVLIGKGFPRSPALPYFNGNITNEVAFVTMSITDMYAMLFGSCFAGMEHAWAHKWRGNRALRPEAFAGHVHRAKITATNPLGLDASLFATYGGIDFLAWVRAYNTIQETGAVHTPLPVPQAETYLISQVYPEGSPCHPTYPSGHATFSGASVTILKAFFSDLALIKDYIQPVKPDPADPTLLVNLPDGEGANLLTLHGELDKLASNVAMGRNFAGIHYRCDAEQGILLGEEVAIRYLQDQARVYAEDGFTGFELTKRNGQRIRITADAVTVI